MGDITGILAGAAGATETAAASSLAVASDKIAQTTTLVQQLSREISGILNNPALSAGAVIMYSNHLERSFIKKIQEMTNVTKQQREEMTRSIHTMTNYARTVTAVSAGLISAAQAAIKFRKEAVEITRYTNLQNLPGGGTALGATYQMSQFREAMGGRYNRETVQQMQQQFQQMFATYTSSMGGTSQDRDMRIRRYAELAGLYAQHAGINMGGTSVDLFRQFGRGRTGGVENIFNQQRRIAGLSGTLGFGTAEETMRNVLGSTQSLMKQGGVRSLDEAVQQSLNYYAMVGPNGGGLGEQQASQLLQQLSGARTNLGQRTALQRLIGATNISPGAFGERITGSQGMEYMLRSLQTAAQGLIGNATNVTELGVSGQARAEGFARQLGLDVSSLFDLASMDLDAEKIKDSVGKVQESFKQGADGLTETERRMKQVNWGSRSWQDKMAPLVEGGRRWVAQNIGEAFVDPSTLETVATLANIVTPFVLMGKGKLRTTGVGASIEGAGVLGDLTTEEALANLAGGAGGGGGGRFGRLAQATMGRKFGRGARIGGAILGGIAISQGLGELSESIYNPSMSGLQAGATGAAGALEMGAGAAAMFNPMFALAAPLGRLAGSTTFALANLVGLGADFKEMKLGEGWDSAKGGNQKAWKFTTLEDIKSWEKEGGEKMYTDEEAKRIWETMNKADTERIQDYAMRKGLYDEAGGFGTVLNTTLQGTHDPYARMQQMAEEGRFGGTVNVVFTTADGRSVGETLVEAGQQRQIFIDVTSVLGVR